MVESLSTQSWTQPVQSVELRFLFPDSNFLETFVKLFKYDSLSRSVDPGKALLFYEIK